jgi:hypothetical protein
VPTKLLAGLFNEAEPKSAKDKKINYMENLLVN